MDILSIVVNVLHLLVDVTTVTWMISKDVFRNSPSAKHYSHKNK